MLTTSITFDLPAWIENFSDPEKQYFSDDEKMSLAINLAAENVRQKNGGPFGAAIFDSGSGRLAAVGLNQVVRFNNSCLHAEVTAIMSAQAKIGSYSLNGKKNGAFELFTSCEPCCMCLGATLWSGVRRLVCAATKSDASAIGFDEGPVYESSYQYLESKGISVTRAFLREKAIGVFDLYRETGGVIYNG